MLGEKIDGLVALFEKHHEQMDEALGAMTENVEDLAEQVRILRVAIDDIRCELEWTMRNHAPRRDPPVGLPVVSMPKIARTGSAGGVQKPDEPQEAPPNSTGQLFE